MPKKKGMSVKEFEEKIDKIIDELDDLCLDWILCYNSVDLNGRFGRHGERWGSDRATNILGLLEAAKNSCTLGLLRGWRTRLRKEAGMSTAELTEG